MADLVNHAQIIDDECLAFTGESAGLHKVLSKVGRWLRFGKSKSFALKLYESDGGGFVFIIVNHLNGGKIKGCTDLNADRQPLSDDELKRIKTKRLQRQKAEREKVARKDRMLSDMAKRLWRSATPYHLRSEPFPYLVRKREQIALNAKFYKSHKRDVLLLPMVCPFYGLKSLYVIDAKGFKRPLLGSAMNGLMMGITDKPLSEVLIIWIVEGYATGLSLHRSVNEAVVVAFTAGNLLNVVEKLVKKYPNARLKLCADNDIDTFNKRGFNPGIDAANKVKKAFPDVEIFIPEFPEGASGLSDFNDLSCYLEDQQEVANDHR